MEPQIKMMDIANGIRITITADEQYAVDQIRRHKQEFYNFLKHQELDKQNSVHKVHGHGD